MRRMVVVVVGMCLLGCAGAQREARSIPVHAVVAAPAPEVEAPAPAPEASAAGAAESGAAAPGAVSSGAPGAVSGGAPGAVSGGAPGAVSGGAPGASGPAPATSRLFSEAVAAFEAGHLDEARRLFEAVLEADGEHVAARYDLGVIAERQGDLPAAENAYRAAVDLTPSHPWALLNLCKVLREQGRAAEAVALLEAALQQPGRANDIPLLNALAVAYRAAGQRDRAEAAARKVLARSGDDPEAYRVLALCALDQGNARLAELYALAARKRAEQDASVANTLGLVYLRMGDRPRALAELRRSLALDPSFAPAHLNLGSLALSSRDYATAERSFARALELQPWSRSASLLRAWALDGLRAQDPRRGVDAGTAFEKVLAFRPDDPEATCGAGFGYAADRAGYDRAVPFLEKCQQLAGTPQERQAAEVKLKTIQAVLSAAPEAAPEERGEGSGGSGEVPPAGEEGEAAEEGSPGPAR